MSRQRKVSKSTEEIGDFLTTLDDQLNQRTARPCLSCKNTFWADPGVTQCGPCADTLPKKSIHTLILESKEIFEGMSPAQDLFTLLLREEEQEGPRNDGLLASYIQEAYDALDYLVRLLQEERIYQKIMAGERVYVRIRRNGNQFSIRKTPTDTMGLPCYDILSPQGRIEKRGIILNKTELRNWLMGLVLDEV